MKRTVEIRMTRIMIMLVLGLVALGFALILIGISGCSFRMSPEIYGPPYYTGPAYAYPTYFYRAPIVMVSPLPVIIGPIPAPSYYHYYRRHYRHHDHRGHSRK